MDCIMEDYHHLILTVTMDLLTMLLIQLFVTETKTLYIFFSFYFYSFSSIIAQLLIFYVDLGVVERAQPGMVDSCT